MAKVRMGDAIPKKEAKRFPKQLEKQLRRAARKENGYQQLSPTPLERA